MVANMGILGSSGFGQVTARTIKRETPPLGCGD
jgi:hypothetical protein